MSEDRKTILVTGASRGIGRAVAYELGARGYDVVVHFVNSATAAEETAAAVRAHGVDARLLRFDVSDRRQARSVLEADIAAHGAYYGIVLNAGMHKDNVFPAMTPGDWDDVVHTNLHGFYNVLHPAVMPMIRRRAPGRIVVMSSVAGTSGNRGQTNYAASKAGLIGAAKSLALELAKRGITVNCVAPGLIETDMTTAVPAEYVRETVPLRRMGTPQEVAKLVGFLCSEDSAYITRQVIHVDGGLT